MSSESAYQPVVTKRTAVMRPTTRSAPAAQNRLVNKINITTKQPDSSQLQDKPITTLQQAQAASRRGDRTDHVAHSAPRFHPQHASLNITHTAILESTPEQSAVGAENCIQHTKNASTQTDRQNRQNRRGHRTNHVAHSAPQDLAHFIRHTLREADGGDTPLHEGRTREVPRSVPSTQSIYPPPPLSSLHLVLHISYRNIFHIGASLCIISKLPISQLDA